MKTSRTCIFDRRGRRFIPGRHHQLAELGLDDSAGQQLSDLAVSIGFVDFFRVPPELRFVVLRDDRSGCYPFLVILGRVLGRGAVVV